MKIPEKLAEGVAGRGVGTMRDQGRNQIRTRAKSAQMRASQCRKQQLKNKRGRMAPYPSRGFRWDEPRGHGRTAGSLTDVGSAP